MRCSPATWWSSSQGSACTTRIRSSEGCRESSREADLSGTHERAPDGFLLAYGSAVQHGRPQRGSIVDVTPTLLYFFGLPVALDMDGFARSDLFTREFTTERPITFIPSYR